MKHPLDRIRVAGFKSIRDQEVGLESLNVLIGANGAGKSNFVGALRLLNEIVNEHLQVSVATAGGADQLLFQGRKRTEEIHLELTFGLNGYRCTLVPTDEDSLVFKEEVVLFRGPGFSKPYEQFLGSGQKETSLRKEKGRKSRSTIQTHVLEAFRSWKIYHFHDTSSSAKVKQLGHVDDNQTLRTDAGNLAAFLFLLQEKEPERYRNIVDTVRMVAPFFDDFILSPDRRNESRIRLEWRERGSDSYLGPQSLSDGTLRFLSLATLLLQAELPTTILLDEPELGLHPYAITVLTELLRAAATRTQVVVCTQSVTLVNQLSPEEILIVDRNDGESQFRRLSEDQVSGWLDDYSLGELWEKNVLGGRPGA